MNAPTAQPDRRQEASSETTPADNYGQRPRVSPLWSLNDEWIRTLSTGSCQRQEDDHSLQLQVTALDHLSFAEHVEPDPDQASGSRCQLAGNSEDKRKCQTVPGECIWKPRPWETTGQVAQVPQRVNLVRIPINGRGTCKLKKLKKSQVKKKKYTRPNYHKETQASHFYKSQD